MRVVRGVAAGAIMGLTAALVLSAGTATAGPRSRTDGFAQLRSSASPGLASIGFVSAGTNTWDVLGGLTGSGGPSVIAPFTNPEGGVAKASAISPDGNTALFGNAGPSVAQVRNLRTNPRSGPTLDFSAFSGEGGSDYSPNGYGVALADSVGLVSLNSAGAAQLRRTNGLWRIDTRVHSPGTNEAGDPHQPGWIRFAGPSKCHSGDSTYDGVVVSNLPLPDGDRVGLAIDRTEKCLAIVEGLGTKNPTVRVLHNPAMGSATVDFSDSGNGGMAFSPVTATRALIIGADGLYVLKLDKPAHPRLVNVAPATGGISLASVSVAPDGNHVAIAADDVRNPGDMAVFIGTGLLHDRRVLRPVARVTPDSSGSYKVYAVQYLRNGNLLINRSGNDGGGGTAYFASLMTDATTNGAHVAKSTALAGPPKEVNTMSAYPVLSRLAMHLHHRHLKVGKKARLKLSVSGGVGKFGYAVTKGHLPKGLAVHGNRISGRPKHAGKKRFTIRAENPYGGAVFTTFRLKVRH